MPYKQILHAQRRSAKGLHDQSFSIQMKYPTSIINQSVLIKTKIRLQRFYQNIDQTERQKNIFVDQCIKNKLRSSQIVNEFLSKIITLDIQFYNIFNHELTGSTMGKCLLLHKDFFGLATWIEATFVLNRLPCHDQTQNSHQ